MTNNNYRKRWNNLMLSNKPFANTILSGAIFKEK